MNCVPGAVCDSSVMPPAIRAPPFGSAAIPAPARPSDIPVTVANVPEVPREVVV